MSDFTEDMEVGAALYEDYLDELDRKEIKLEKKKANDVYEYHTDSLNNKCRIADMNDSHLINSYRYFRKKFEYKRAFAFYIELRLRYPKDWREKVGDVE
jgi:hypothetical protein